MKKKDIKKALEALKKVPVAKIKDTKLKQAIIRSYMQLLAERSKLQEQEDGIRALFLDQYQDEQKEVSKLFIELQNTEDGDKRKAISAEFEKHGSCIMAADEMAKELKKINDETVSIDAIDEEGFIKAYGQIGDVDLAVLEAIYPLLK